MDERIARGESAVVACSALKRSYRDLLLGGRPEARMVFLAVGSARCWPGGWPPGTATSSPEQLLGTQFDALEPPQPDEHVITVVPAGEPAATVASIIALLFPDEGVGSGASGRGGDHEAEA